MENVRDYIEERLKDLEETYDFYLNRLDKTYDDSERRQFENRLRELRVEKNTLSDVLEKIGEENENMVSNKKH